MATVFELLDREWRRMREDRTTARQLADACHLAGSARTLGELERFVRAAAPPIADRVLLALVARAVVGDALAARVLLQMLLPGTRTMARRWWAVGDPDERAAAAVAAVYGRIRSYPLARRPGRVAANVLMDAERELRRLASGAAVTPVADPAAHASRAGRASGTAHQGTVDRPDRVDPAGWYGGVDRGVAPVPHPAIELTEVLRDAVDDQVIGADDAMLIARSRIGGERVADIAERRGLAARTLWDRRQRAERSLVAAATAFRHPAAV